MSDVLKAVEKGEKLLQKGRAGEAFEEFRAALQQQPDDEALLTRITEALANAGDNARASLLLGERFERLVSAKQVPQAIAFFQRLQSMEAQPPKRVMAFAALLEANKRPQEAERAYRLAASGFQRAGELEMEVAAWKNIFRLNNSDSSTCLEVAGRAEAAGDNELAGEAAAKAATLCGEDPLLLERACRLLHNRRDVVLRYAKALLTSGKASEGLNAIKKLPNFTADEETASLYADAMVGAGEAEAVRDLIATHLHQGNDWFGRGLRCLAGLVKASSGNAVIFSKTLEEYLTSDERRVEWIAVLEQAVGETSQDGFLAYLSEKFEQAHKQAALVRALYRRFDIALGASNFPLAAQLLEHASKVDAYAPALTERVPLLRGKIEQGRWDKLNRAAGGESDQDDFFQPPQADFAPASEPAPTIAASAPPQRQDEAAWRRHDEVRAPAAARRSTAAGDQREPSQANAATPQQVTGVSGSMAEQSGQEGASFEDLILQGEIFLQYRLVDKARECARTLASLFPGEEATNTRLAHLYEATGVRPPKVPAATSSAPVTVTAPAPPPTPAPPPPAPVAQPALATAQAASPSVVAAPPPVVEAAAVIPPSAPAPVPAAPLAVAVPVVAPPAPQGPPLNQIVQTTRALHRESTARRIFFSAVNHLGRLWRADRCLAAKFNAGQPPSHVVEYCAQGINKSEPAAVARLLNTLEAQFNSTGTRVLQLPRANETAAIRQTLERLGVDSLLAHALEEGGTVGGVVVLELCTSEREWSSYDNEVLEALSDQIVLALGNARLRGLLRQFATVDDRTGLLQISSIMELLVAECAQAQDQRSSVSVLCLELLRKEGIDFRRPEVAKWLDGIGQKITAYLRPNDAAGRLKPGSFVIVLPETSSPNCGVIVERLRNVLKDFAWPDAQPLYLAAGAAEIASEPTLPTGDMKLQPEDIATDLLDRACRAVAQQRNGNEPVTILPPQPLSAIRTGSIQGEAEMAATRGR